MMRPLTIAACLALTTAVAFMPTSSRQRSQAPPPPPRLPPPPAAAAAPKGNADTRQAADLHLPGLPRHHRLQERLPELPRAEDRRPVGAYLLNALTEYKKGTRKHPTMQAQAQSFSDQDIADIAAYLSTLK